MDFSFNRIKGGNRLKAKVGNFGIPNLEYVYTNSLAVFIHEF